MGERFLHFLGGLPFFMLTGGNKIKMNWARIIEGVLIAVFTAALTSSLTSYVMLRETGIKLQYLEASDKEMKQKIECIDERVYKLAQRINGHD